jgi:YidC/Oxa1 family membrane protein insertase
MQIFMDRNSVIGFSLIFLILIGYYWYTAPTPEQQAALQRQQDSLALVELEQTRTQQNQPSSDDPQVVSNEVDRQVDSGLVGVLGSMASQWAGNNAGSVIEFENAELKLAFDQRGGTLRSVVLKNHNSADSGQVALIQEANSQQEWVWNTPGYGPVSSRDFLWQVQTKTDKELVLRLNGNDGAYMDQVYRFDEKQGFKLSYQLVLHDVDYMMQRNNSDLEFTWNHKPVRQERELKWEKQNTTVVYQLKGEQPDKLGMGSEEEEMFKNRLQWVAFKQQYFSCILAAQNGFATDSKVRANELPETMTGESAEDGDPIRQLGATLFIEYGREADKTYDFAYYFGPNHYRTLDALDLGVDNGQFQRIVPLGWGIFGWVNRYIVIPVFDLLDDRIASMGIIILLLTFIIKLILLPLVYKSYLSTAKMRILKPEIDIIKTKYSDVQKQQAENMALYRKAGVSPMSGCVPMLFQLPILFALFQFFPNAFELRQKSFLWASDLSTWDGPALGFHIPFYGDHVSIFTLMMTASTLLYTHLNNQISGVTGQMKYIGYFMPIIFLGVLNDYASGLTWYYFVSNIITFSQQFIIRRMVDDEKLKAQIAENKKKPVTKSKFQQRMEDAMKASQQKAKR